MSTGDVSDIRDWLKRGEEEGATHVVVRTDTFDGNVYPVYIKPGDDLKAAVNFDDGFTKTNEVYNLALNINAQLDEFRAWHE